MDRGDYVVCFVFVFTGVALMPSVVYLCVTLFTELFNLAGGDVAVLVAVPTLEQRQAAADPTLPGSCSTRRKALNEGERQAGLEVRSNTTMLSSELIRHSLLNVRLALTVSPSLTHTHCLQGGL